MHRWTTLQVLAAFAGALLISVAGFPQASQTQSSVGRAQSQGAGQANPAPPVVRVTTRMVQVNVIVHDRDGKPVAGLTKGDFHILDEGEPQTISFFAEQTTRLTVPAATQVSTKVFSNHAEEQAGVPTSVTVILLDWLNTAQHSMAFARPQVIKFLRTQIQPQDRVALYGLSSKRLFNLHDFTNDSAALLRVLDRATQKKAASPQGKGAAEPDSEDARLDQFLAEADAHPRTVIVDQVGMTSNALKIIANRLANIPGRKNLVWVSSSFPSSVGYSYRMSMGTSAQGRFPPSLFNQQTTDAARALSNANVAIYPVDARGLIPNPPFARYDLGSAFPPPEQFDTMIALARATGGRAFYNNNDIRGAIRRAIDDSRVTYVLGYYPTHNQWNGEFRNITVKTDRKGVEMRYRSGYFASPPAGAADPNRQQQSLADAITSPLESTELDLDVEADPVDVPGARQLKTRIRVTPSEMHFEEKDGRWTDALEVIWVELDKEGKITGTHTQTFRFRPTQEEYQALLRIPFDVSETVSVSESAAEVRIVVSDTGSGAIGSVNIPLSRLFTPAAMQPATKQ